MRCNIPQKYDGAHLVYRNAIAINHMRYEASYDVLQAEWWAFAVHRT